MNSNSNLTRTNTTQNDTKANAVLHYENTKDNSNVIYVKGTIIYNPKGLISDVKLGLGIQSPDKQFIIV